MRIAYLSYTVAASEVVAQRVQMAPAERLWFRTIHSCCAQVTKDGERVMKGHHYKEFSKATGYQLTVRDGELVEGASRHDDSDFGAVLQAHKLAKSKCITIQESVLQQYESPLLIPAVYVPFLQELEAFKQKYDLIDFEDMLLRYLNSNCGPLPVDVALLDEAQDCSELQWQVFTKMIGDAKRVYIGGDDDQAIFSFMGGSEYGFLDYPADHNIILTKSYRVPAAIGRRATNLIKKISRRQDKDVQWKDAPGDVEVLNFEVESLPWRQWQADKKGVFVLTRHRNGARVASNALLSIGVSHALGKHVLHNSPLAKHVRDYWIISRGEKVSWRRMANVLKVIDGADAAEAVRTQGQKNKNLLLGREDCPAEWNSPQWVTLFAADMEESEKVYAIVDIIRQEGESAIGQEPMIHIMTMHGSKGREADIVVVVPDCQRIVYDHMHDASEVRTSYVAITRAKESTIILEPRSRYYIEHLMGV